MRRRSVNAPGFDGILRPYCTPSEKFFGECESLSERSGDPASRGFREIEKRENHTPPSAGCTPERPFCVADLILLHGDSAAPMLWADREGVRIGVTDTRLGQHPETTKNAPTPEPLRAAGVNCNGIIDLGDLGYLIMYRFRNAPPVCGR